jgi:hypothetical protein
LKKELRDEVVFTEILGKADVLSFGFVEVRVCAQTKLSGWIL